VSVRLVVTKLNLALKGSELAGLLPGAWVRALEDCLFALDGNKKKKKKNMSALSKTMLTSTVGFALRISLTSASFPLSAARHNLYSIVSNTFL